jgi:4-hydroxythreonine-4-phosphate dehydrogenase
MVTAPVHKGVICDAGIAFTGHTEFLAAHFRIRQVVMMLVGGRMRVALATTHLPLGEVCAAITRPGLEQTLRIVVAELQAKFGIATPRVLVAGLNPHAGESGHMGREEIEIIDPFCNACAAKDSGSRARCPRTRCSSRSISMAPTWSWRCTTTRACRC